MSVRLAFSTAIQVDADVLLVDEVLAVGDAGFQRKCFEEFHRLKAEGKTIVFVTHDMSAVERFCDRAMLIEHGGIVSIDAPDVIARAYNQLNFGRIAAPGEAPAPSGVGRVLDAWFEDPAGERASELEQDEALTMCADVEFHGDADDPHFSFHLRNEARHIVFATGSAVKLGHSGRYAAGDRVQVRATLQNWFAPGHYAVSVTVATPAGEVLDVREDIAALVVRGSRHFGGVMEIPHGFELVR
jgi:energy-coupling factor transporter ATP-binding protein EcfA2